MDTAGHDRTGAPSATSTAIRSSRDELAAMVVAGDLAPRAFPGRWTEAVDGELARLFADATEPLRAAAGYSLVAVGGYGRGDLCPGSDLDLLLLHDKKKDVKSVADAIWYRIWDSGIRLDHSVRTPKEALALASGELRVVAGLLDGRVVAGDRALADELFAKVAEVWRSHHRQLLPLLAEATRERHQAFGELPFLLEPDLKESAGGLRDIEAMRLAARALPALADVLAPDSLASARDLLLSSRVALQARTGNRSDRLLLQEQDEVASLLGFADADEYAAVLAAAGREVMWASEDGWRRMESVLRGPSRKAAGREVPLDRSIVLRDGEVALAEGAEPALDATLVLRVAAAAARQEAPIAVTTLERLEAERPELPTPWEEPLREAFVSLLEYGAAAIPVIETLDRRRLFEWILPEWSLVRHRPQRNAYHRFTVDRHLLEAVAQAVPLLRTVERPDLLLVAALLHDIGKGQPGDHSEVGRELAVRAARRMGYGARDLAVLGRVVKRHLLLADTATRRDLDDPETIEVVAEALGDVLTLEVLAALTEADSIATGTAAWGPWKASLIRELVDKVRAFLEGRPVDTSPTRRVSPAVAALAAEGRLAVEVDGNTVTVVAPDRAGLFSTVAGVLALHRLDIRRATAIGLEAPAEGGTAMAVDQFDVERDPARPIDRAKLCSDLERALDGELALGASLRTVEEAYARYRRPAAAASPGVVVLFDESTSASASVVEVRAPDSHGLLHRLAAVFARSGLDVVSAKIATLGHEVVDSFYVRDSATGAPLSPERLDALRPLLVEAASSSPGGAAPGT